jgi:hypothetical protein
LPYIPGAQAHLSLRLVTPSGYEYIYPDEHDDNSRSNERSYEQLQQSVQIHRAEVIHSQPTLLLTSRAEMGRPLSQTNAPNRTATLGTGLFLAPINQELLLITPTFVSIIGQAGPFLLNGKSQHMANRLIQAPLVLLAQGIGPALRLDACQKERLV